MKIAFCKSSLPLSVLIRWGLQEPVSHAVFIFNDYFAVHSDLLGVHLTTIDKIKKADTIVYTLNYALTPEEEFATLKRLLTSALGEPYDFGAFFYFIWRALLKRVFGKPLPTKNLFQIDDMLMCTEVAGDLPANGVLATEIVNPLKTVDLGMTSPYQLYLFLAKLFPKEAP